MGVRLYHGSCLTTRRKKFFFQGYYDLRADCMFIEALSKEEAEGKLLVEARSRFPSGGGWQIMGLVAGEVPQELIDKFATPKSNEPDKPETTWAVSPDAEQTVRDVPKAHPSAP